MTYINHIPENDIEGEMIIWNMSISISLDKTKRIMCISGGNSIVFKKIKVRGPRRYGVT